MYTLSVTELNLVNGGLPPAVSCAANLVTSFTSIYFARGAEGVIGLGIDLAIASATTIYDNKCKGLSAFDNFLLIIGDKAIEASCKAMLKDGFLCLIYGNNMLGAVNGNVLVAVNGNGQ